MPTGPPSRAAAPEALAPDLVEFMDALALSAGARAELHDALIEGEVLDIETACMLDPADWKSLGLKLGTRTKVVSRLASYRR
mmetsp:Transcript_33568/g.103979  ORF Transcript_33568/g.103979 Transcript_33568/m.103979 type:complete len:82 (-) Transcript_33568:62-307(-)